MENKYVIEQMLEKESKLTWNNNKREYIETPKEVIEFLKDIESVCKKHNMSISHEDYQGGFELDEYNERNIRWLCKANIYK